MLDNKIKSSIVESSATMEYRGCCICRRVSILSVVVTSFLMNENILKSVFLLVIGTMKYALTTLAVSLFLFHLHRAISEDAQVRIFNQWPRGFYGRISIDLEDEVDDGWQVTVTFSKPVARLVAWNAKVDSVSDDKKVYVLKNRFWNADLEAGRKLKFRFLARKGKFGENAPEVLAEFTRLGEESGSGS